MPDFNNTIKKVERFAKLAEGWRFGIGSPIAEDKIEIATQLLNYGFEKRIDRFNAFAGDDGSLMVCFYCRDITIDLTIEDNKMITYTFDEGNEQKEFIQELSILAAKEKMMEVLQDKIS